MFHTWCFQHLCLLLTFISKSIPGFDYIRLEPCTYWAEEDTHYFTHYFHIILRLSSQKKLCSGNHKATEEEGDRGILGEEIWSQKWEQQDSSTAAWRKMKAAGQERTGWRKVVCGICCTRHKSSRPKSIYPHFSRGDASCHPILF